MTELTLKQELFCKKYIELGNASEAYRQSYNAENMKDDTVHRKAFDLLENGKITARLNELRKEHLKHHNITVDSLVLGLDLDLDLDLDLERIRSDGDNLFSDLERILKSD
ncbi:MULTISPECIES: terminase small subunit [Pasteurellaceae]|uniref:Terminase small subunit n=1 Tax=Pasteurella atlantica TaxID=2827233 RepID=A0AAW8CQS4_9PAST|nr:terminase small subunit [Pasteurella atlantica]MBR0574671.1 terminase small subunit [Pasteurella atlantica]MDP8040586.1 terminase small subunit [Pasteurella atlantica]MDP8042716.1 terminase small subunit [Pasteurella atlantica]MDP8044799.1 terminase small subunit [Pasteurella atlantica]MDP8046896.1 terminase small subunit [Pasteurella atlantica]